MGERQRDGARADDAICKVARTVANQDDVENQSKHMAEAVGYRELHR
jgi:predicted ATPase with chaperone activity